MTRILDGGEGACGRSPAATRVVDETEYHEGVGARIEDGPGARIGLQAKQRIKYCFQIAKPKADSEALFFALMRILAYIIWPGCQCRKCLYVACFHSSMAHA